MVCLYENGFAFFFDILRNDQEPFSLPDLASYLPVIAIVSLAFFLFINPGQNLSQISVEDKLVFCIPWVALALALLSVAFLFFEDGIMVYFHLPRGFLLLPRVGKFLLYCV